MRKKRLILIGIFQLTTSRRGRHHLSSICSDCDRFQLTTSRRGRLDLFFCHCSSRSFQLTTSRRGRHDSPDSAASLLRTFNSRPHEEVDDLHIQNSPARCHLSTHDLTKRSTSLLHISYHNWGLSTHDLTKRSTGFV